MDNKDEVIFLNLDDIIPNRFQPREVFDDQALKELAVSIREHGVIQPIIVRKVENKYEIIAGERRYKASTMAGLTKIPAIIKDLDDKESSKVALIENLQRKDLSPIEEARTYQKILELEDGMTQEQLAATMGKTQSSVSNKLRLLALPDEVQDALLKDKISERHARSLLNIEDKNEQIKMMDKVIAEKMTVRELDKEIKIMKGEVVQPEEAPALTIEPETQNNNEISSEVTPPPMMSTDIIQTEPEAQNDNLNNQEVPPTIDTNIQVTTETTPATVALATINVNPTSVDIDKIRENSTDINPTNPPAMEVKDLLKNPNEDTFKFVPSFGDTTTETTPTEQTEPPKGEFIQFFSTNTDEQAQSENNLLASSLTTSEISVPSATPVKDITQAVTDVKTTITNLQSNGYNVSFEESDNPNDYKITIQINKN